MTIIAKSCNSLPGSPDESESIWPGLFMQKIGDFDRTQVKLKNTNPAQPATVLCTSKETDCRSNSRPWKSSYPPWDDVQFQPEITLPETPTPPAEDTLQYAPPRRTSKSKVKQLWADIDEESNTPLAAASSSIGPALAPEERRRSASIRASTSHTID